MKKPGAGSTGKSGLGSIGKSGLGGGKSGITSSSKSGGILGSSGKSSYSSTSKSLSPTSKSSISPTSKSSGGLTAKSASPKPSKSFDFIPSSKPTSLTPSSPKNYPSSSSYNVYGTPKSGKSATFGIIWIPTGKRNKKKKDIVLSSNNDDRRRDRSPSFYKFMSGDSHDVPHKKDEETNLLVVPERKIASGVIAATESAIAGNVAAPNLEDKQSLLKDENEESKEAAGDSKDNDSTDDDKDYLNNDESVRHKLPDTLTDKATYGDNVDSVYLRPPPPHKARSTAATPDEDSCGIKCLYYTLQCCDCVLITLSDLEFGDEACRVYAQYVRTGRTYCSNTFYLRHCVCCVISDGDCTE